MHSTEKVYLSIILIYLAAVLLIDLYAFRGVRLLIGEMKNQLLRNGIYIFYWTITSILIVGIIYCLFNIRQIQMHNPKFLNYLLGAIILLIVPKIIFILFLGIEDLGYFAFGLYHKLFSGSSAVGEVITRRAFLTQTGAILALIPFTSIAYGIVKGKYDFRVLRKKLSFNNLPKNFNGLKIAIVSDIHIGSFGDNYNAVKKGIDMVNALEPDVIFFTGDLVNDFAHETNGWLPYLSEFKAKKAKYSILGNHDYGDYVSWNSVEEKQNNLAKVIEFNKKMGFQILLNESVKMNIDGEEIAIIGVENWGTPPFPQYGDLKKAMNGVEDVPFKILLSHDPSHWGAEVLNTTNIDITLSGHTHGMQFGVEIGSIKWSPVQMRYPRWGGLYTEGKQHLYVNRGFGFIGFPGRVGMPPEITFIELEKT